MPVLTVVLLPGCIFKTIYKNSRIAHAIGDTPFFGDRHGNSRHDPGIDGIDP